jgi:hypothetical protein
LGCIFVNAGAVFVKEAELLLARHPTNSHQLRRNHCMHGLQEPPSLVDVLEVGLAGVNLFQRELGPLDCGEDLAQCLFIEWDWSAAFRGLHSFGIRFKISLIKAAG